MQWYLVVLAGMLLFEKMIDELEFLSRTPKFLTSLPSSKAGSGFIQVTCAKE